jgi:hypothetical protein
MRKTKSKKEKQKKKVRERRKNILKKVKKDEKNRRQIQPQEETTKLRRRRQIYNYIIFILSHAFGHVSSEFRTLDSSYRAVQDRAMNPVNRYDLTIMRSFSVPGVYIIYTSRFSYVASR